MDPPTILSSNVVSGEMDLSSTGHLVKGSIKDAGSNHSSSIDTDSTEVYSLSSSTNTHAIPHSNKSSFLSANATTKKKKVVHFNDISLADLLERKRIDSEIKTTFRSLKTNFLLTSAFLATFLSAFLLPNCINVVLSSIVKGMVPILTTITNFGKIQNLFESYFSYFVQKFETCGQ